MRLSIFLYIASQSFTNGKEEEKAACEERE